MDYVSIKHMPTLSLEQINQLFREEESASDGVLQLTSNEAVLSPDAQKVLASPLSNRYLLEHVDMRGDSPSRLGGFLFRGLDNINKIEQSAHECCRLMFDAEFAEFRCLSGLHAMLTTLVSLSNPGDKIMRFSTKDGGHFATEHLIKLLGRRDCCCVIDRRKFDIDIEKTKEVFEREKPTLIYIDAMNYVFPFSIAELRKVVGDTTIVFDGSHTIGLIAGKQFPNPLSEGADILQANTHKTLFGPQKGIIVSNNRALMEKISYNLSSGLVSSQHTASSVSLFIALHEMLSFGTQYAKEVVENAQYLARRLHEKGFKIIGNENGFTKIHQFYIDVTDIGSGPLIMKTLLDANIAVNRTMPFENIDALRVGVQELTRRGISKCELDQIADWFARLILQGEDPDDIRSEVEAFVRDKQGRIFFCRALDPEAATGRTASTPKRFAGLPRWVDFSPDEKKCDLPDGVFKAIRELAGKASKVKQQTDSTGNLSIKNRDRIFVTTSGSYMKNLKPTDFAEITGKQGNVLRYAGASVPSSEALLHFLVLRNIASNFVVHNHYLPSDEEISRHGIQVIAPQEYGSVKLAEAVAEACARGKIVFIRKHGLVMHHETLEGCAELIGKFVTES